MRWEAERGDELRVNTHSSETAGPFRSPSMDQRGLSRLETAIVGLAFVALSAGFVFFVLATGVLTAAQSRAAVLGALEQATVSIALDGPPVGEASVDGTRLERIRLKVVLVSPGLGGIVLSGEHLLVRYIDSSQAMLVSPSDWTATWIAGSGAVLNPGESAEITVDLRGLDPPLGPSQDFTVELLPDAGAAVSFARTTPAHLSDVTVLR